MATVVQELEAATVRITELTTEAEKSIAALATMTNECNAAKAALAVQQEASVKSATAEKSAQDALKSEQEAHAQTKDLLDKARSALANPAHTDAAMHGQKETVVEGAPAADAPAMTYEQAQSAYAKIEGENAIETARLKEAFRAKHAKILRLG